MQKPLGLVKVIIFGILVLKMQDGGARLYIVIKVMLFVERLTMLIPPLLYDLLGDLKAFDDFVEMARMVKEFNNCASVSFALVLKYLKEHTDFNYKAIRILAVPSSFKSTNIHFPKRGIYLAQIGKVQICFFKKNLFKGSFKVTEEHPRNGNLTI